MTARLPSPRRMTDREIANERRRLRYRTEAWGAWALDDLKREIVLRAEQSRRALRRKHARTAARKRARKGEM